MSKFNFSVGGAAAAALIAAVAKNGNKVDAILVPNDKIADTCVDVSAELKVITSIVITAGRGNW